MFDPNRTPDRLIPFALSLTYEEVYHLLTVVEAGIAVAQAHNDDPRDGPLVEMTGGMRVAMRPADCLARMLRAHFDSTPNPAGK